MASASAEGRSSGENTKRAHSKTTGKPRQKNGELKKTAKKLKTNEKAATGTAAPKKPVKKVPAKKTAKPAAKKSASKKVRKPLKPAHRDLHMVKTIFSTLGEPIIAAPVMEPSELSEVADIDKDARHAATPLKGSNTHLPKKPLGDSGKK
ncbi:hypothetical protein [Niabella hirudinis]|uniref:hypothetical protein n=1 Tax=Niabella hirudinis TaxID=1285929 RepID=UPI003EBE92CE